MNYLPKAFHLIFLNLNCLLNQIQNQHLISKIELQKVLVKLLIKIYKVLKISGGFLKPKCIFLVYNKG